MFVFFNELAVQWFFFVNFHECVFWFYIKTVEKGTCKMRYGSLLLLWLIFSHILFSNFSIEFLIFISSLPPSDRLLLVQIFLWKMLFLLRIFLVSMSKFKCSCYDQLIMIAAYVGIGTARVLIAQFLLIFFEFFI